MKKIIAVIGGGASGLIAAITAKKYDNEVIIFEKNDRVLKKLLVTGNGRCNYTNVNATSKNYFEIDKGHAESIFAKKILEQFNVSTTIEFFESIGILPKINENGKIYPLSLQASSVVDCLRLKAESLDIKIIINSEIENIIKKDNKFLLYTSKSNMQIVDKIIITAGGKSYPKLSSNGSGYNLAKKINHTVTKLNPVLVQIKTEKEKIKGLEGIKSNVKVSVIHNNKIIKSSNGEILFTKYGLSGPVIFDTSYLISFFKDIIFQIDFMEEYSFDELFELLKKRQKDLDHLTMENFLNGIVKKKLGQFLIKNSGIEKLSLKVKELNEKQLKKITEILKKYNIKSIGTLGFDDAQVTAGGIPTKEINNETLESKKLKNIYFAGEVIDIFGECGGYNLQWAWSSGYVAGKNAAE